MQIFNIIFAEITASLPIFPTALIVRLLDSFRVLLSNIPVSSMFINNCPPTDSFFGRYMYILTFTRVLYMAIFIFALLLEIGVNILK